MKISQLTSQQERRMVDLQRQWLSIGHSCAPIDRTAAAQIITGLYERMGKPKPLIMFFSSPMMCMRARSALLYSAETEEQLGPHFGSELWWRHDSQFCSRIESQLKPQFEPQLAAHIKSQLESPLDSQLSAIPSLIFSQLESQLRSHNFAHIISQPGAPVGAQLTTQLQLLIESQLHSAFLGQHCDWQVYFNFCREIGARFQVNDSDLLDLWLRHSRHLHCWFAYDRIALVSERHTLCQLDSQSRPHSETSQAIEYSDGWGLWAWHGFRVDQRIVQRPDLITAREILAERNAELRRVMIERIGMQRFLGESGASCIHRHEIGDLFSIDLPGDPEQVLRSVRVKDPSTGRIYFLRVPPSISRADDAVAWTFSFDTAAQYHPTVET